MILKGIALFCLASGIFVLIQVIMPLLMFKAWEVFALGNNQILVDPKGGSLEGSSVLGVSVQNTGNFPAFISNDLATTAPYKQFKISIPSIGLRDISVLVNSNDFEKSLAHLPGSTLPGFKGNVFVTGHSSLPNSDILKGSKVFFADLPKVKKGEEIQIEALGQIFRYEVINMKIVDPKDISVINPPDNEGRYLTVMTCVPPGFNTKRLIILAILK